MSVVKELLRTEADGTISFGNYELDQKAKLSDYEYNGDLYKVKTFKEITMLERNGMLVYESVPGTAVTGFAAGGNGVNFTVEGPEDAQVILGLEEDTEYKVSIDGNDMGMMKTNMGGKLVLSVEMGNADHVEVCIEK